MVEQQKNYLHISVFGSLWNTLQFLSTGATSFVLSIVLTRYLGANEYGVYAYLNWFSSVIIIFLNFGLTTTVQTFIPKYYFGNQLDEARQHVQQLLKLQLIIIAASLVILIPLVLNWGHLVSFGHANFTKLMVINLLSILILVLNNFFATLMIALQRFKTAVVITIAGQAMFLVATILTVVLNLHIFGVLISLAAVNTVILIVYVSTNRSLITIASLLQQPISYKKIFAFSGWAYANLLLTAIIWDKSEFFFLGMYHVGRDVAFYGIAYALTTTIVSVFDPIITVFVNLLSELVAKGDWQRVRFIIAKSSKYISLIVLPMITAVFLLGRYVINLMYGSEYLLVAAILPVLLFSMSLVRIFGTAWSIPNYTHTLHRIVPLNILIALLNITLDIFLIPRYDVWGATIANVGTQLSALVFFGWYMNRYRLHLFNREYLTILAANAVLFGGLIAITALHPTFLFTLITMLLSLIVYLAVVIKYFIVGEDRQLIASILKLTGNPFIQKVAQRFS